MKIRALCLIICISAGPVWAQPADSVYHHVLAHWQDQPQQVAGMDTEALSGGTLTADQRYYAQLLIALANRNLKRYQISTELLLGIPLDSVQYKRTALNVQLFLALNLQETGRWKQADDIYRRVLPQIPDAYATLKATHYNNYATVHEYFGNTDRYLQLLDSALYYNAQATDNRKQIRQNLIYKNLSHYYLHLDLNTARKWLQKMDTTGAPDETKATYLKQQAKIAEMTEEYDSSIIYYGLARDLSNQLGMYLLRDEATEGLTRVHAKKEKDKMDTRRNMIIFGIQAAFSALMILLWIRYRRKNDQDIINKYM